MVAKLEGQVTQKGRPFAREGEESSVKVTVFDGVETTDIYVPQSEADKIKEGQKVSWRVQLKAWRDKLQVARLPDLAGAPA